MTWLSSINAEEMLVYVENNYSGRRKEWAPCYRPRAPFKTSNHAESWHSKLKHILLRSKQNGRLDTVVHALLKHSNDRDLQLLSACARGGSDISGRRKKNIHRHKEALSFYKDAQDFIERNGDHCWIVASKSRTDVTYEVTVDGTLCDCSEEMNSHCERCGVCAYQVQCSCPDGSQSGVSCLHAHAVATFQKQAQAMLRPLYHRLLNANCSYLPHDHCPHASEDDVRGPGNDDVPETEGIFVCADDVIREDNLKEEMQAGEGIRAHYSEAMMSLLKSKRPDLMKNLNDKMRNALSELPLEAISNQKSFARRTVMQTTGTGPKPDPIQPQFKTRNKLRKEKKQKEKKQRKYIDDEDDTDSEVQRILATDRLLLQSCFLCGRKEPKEDGENENVLWVSCSNNAVCRAWSHLVCCNGVGQRCPVCEFGRWRHETV